MRAIGNSRTAAEVLVDQLISNGVRHVFCVPGESYLAVLDAFHDRDITVTVCRQEGGAAMMAEAVGKATGRPGVCFVTRGPGATNASPGIHIAQQDSTPLIMFAGQVSRDVKGRGALQELDFRAAFGGMAKWVTEIDDAARVPEIVSRAFYTATSGRPGPVVIALPEDMLNERVTGNDAPAWEPFETSPGAAEMDKLEELLRTAARPLVIVGGTRWSTAAREAMHRFAERFDVPVATSYRRLPLFDPLHRCYAGDLGIGPNPKLVARIKEADVLLLVGGRLGELASQAYTLVDIPAPQTKLVHVHPGAEEIGSVSIGRIWRSMRARRLLPRRWIAWSRPAPFRGASARRPLTPITLRGPRTRHEQPGGVNLGAVMVWLRENLPDDTILCNGAGNYAAWIHRFYRFRKFGDTHRADVGIDGLRNAVGRRDEAPLSRSDRCSRSTATAISS